MYYPPQQIFLLYKTISTVLSIWKETKQKKFSIFVNHFSQIHFRILFFFLYFFWTVFLLYILRLSQIVNCVICTSTIKHWRNVCILYSSISPKNRYYGTYRRFTFVTQGWARTRMYSTRKYDTFHGGWYQYRTMYHLG